MNTERMAQILEAIEDVVIDFESAYILTEINDVVKGVREKIPSATHGEIITAIDECVFAGDLRYRGDHIVLPDNTIDDED